MTAPAPIYVSSIAFGDTNSIDVNYPIAGGNHLVAVGNRLTVAVVGDDDVGGSCDWDLPSGWTSVCKTTSRRGFEVFTKIADAGDVSASTLTVTTQGGQIGGFSVGRMCVVDNGPTIEGSIGNNGFTASVIPGSVTTTKDDELVLCAIAFQSSSSIDVITGATGGTWADDWGPDAASNGVRSFSIDFQYCTKATAGSLSGGVAALSSPLFWFTGTFAIQSPIIVTADFVSAMAFGGGVSDIKPLEIS